MTMDLRYIVAASFQARCHTIRQKNVWPVRSRLLKKILMEDALHQDSVIQSEHPNENAHFHNDDMCEVRPALHCRPSRR